MMPDYRDGWTTGKTDYMIIAPKGAENGDSNGIIYSNSNYGFFDRGACRGGRW